MRAVFLDRDGVLIEDVDLLTRSADIRVLDGVPQALATLRAAGFALIVITNQAVVARGVATEEEVRDLNDQVSRLIVGAGGPAIESFYFCPHHPNATLPAYRQSCECRKPQPGLFLKAAAEREVDLTGSFAVGDRITDIVAGARAGCRTVLTKTGAHVAPPIEFDGDIERSIRPDFECQSLAEAAEWIVGAV